MTPKWIGLIIAITLLSCSDARDELMQELSDPSPIKRSGALRVLAKDGDAEAYRLLTHGLQDSSVIVRIAAVQSLAIFKGRDTTPALIRAARDADPEVREATVIALTSRGGERAEKTLVGILLRKEPSPKVRKKILESLKQLGLTGRVLAEKMSMAQIELVKKNWDDALAPQRARLTRTAGRSIHPAGIEIVARGLGDREAEVVLVALEVLDGRGDKEILRQLLVLASDQAQKIRLAALGELGRYGPEGLAVIRGALRDLDPEVRLLALDEIAENDANLTAEILCPLVTDGNLDVAMAAASLIGKRKLECDLAGLSKGLDDPDSSAYQKTVVVLSRLSGEPVRIVLTGEMNRLPADRKPGLAAALARAGDRSKQVGRLLECSLRTALDELLGLSQSWVGDRLPPRKSIIEKKPPDPDEDESKLSEDQLKQLYQKHGLPPAGEESPRGVTDILKGFPELSGSGGDQRLFLPAIVKEVDRIAELLDALVVYDPESATGYAAESLESDLVELVGRVARIISARRFKVALSDQQLKRLGGMLDSAAQIDAEAIVDLIGSGQDASAARQLTDLLDKVSYEKREHLIAVLGRMKNKQSIPALTGLLSGYSAASAARALGEIGAPQALDGLKEALDNAGPSAKMSILMALARLGCEDIVPTLAELLSNPDPELRRIAVVSLGWLGGQKALQLLQLARYDPDRLVSSEALKHLGGK